MGMLTIRTNEHEHKAILEASAAAGQSSQKWCLARLLDAAAAPLPLEPEPPAPEGHIAIHRSDNGQPVGQIFHIPRPPGCPEKVVRATQFQTGGDWYLESEAGQIVTTASDSAMQPFIPDEYANDRETDAEEGQTATDMDQDLHSGDGATDRGADQAPDHPPDA